MELLQLREREIFEILKKIKKFEFVIIGGYAVNAYTLPRFSVDCDIVSNNPQKILNELKKMGYIQTKSKDDIPYHGKFIRYSKKLDKNIEVSVDIFINKVIDRDSKIIFDTQWIFENSNLRLLKGKTIPDNLRIRIINLEALIVMKIISCRTADIRDIFMLMPSVKDKTWIKEETSKRYNFKNRFNKIKKIITSNKFKDNLQGVYGYIEGKIFEKHKKALLALQ